MWCLCASILCDPNEVSFFCSHLISNSKGLEKSCTLRRGAEIHEISSLYILKQNDQTSWGKLKVIYPQIRWAFFNHIGCPSVCYFIIQIISKPWLYHYGISVTLHWIVIHHAAISNPPLQSLPSKVKIIGSIVKGHLGVIRHANTVFFLTLRIEHFETSPFSVLTSKVLAILLCILTSGPITPFRKS